MTTHELLLDILRIAELMACIVSFALWRKWRGTPWRIFSFYLLFVVLAECVGVYTYRHHLAAVKTFFFNYFEIPIEYLTAYAIFFTYSRTPAEKRLPVYFAVIYIASIVLSAVLSPTLPVTNYSLCMTIGNLLMLTLIVRYFVRLVRSSEILLVQRNILFYACLGWLLFYIVTLPFYGLGNTLMKSYRNIFFLYSYFVTVLNTGMYLCYTAGYLWGNPKY